jgi:hypothetical protein
VPVQVVMQMTKTISSLCVSAADATISVHIVLVLFYVNIVISFPSTSFAFSMKFFLPPFFDC